MHLSGRSEKPVISHEQAFLSPIPPASDSLCLVESSRQIPLTEPPPEASSSVAREYFFAGSKGRTVKASAAARRGSLDRLPAFGTFADVTDGEAGIFRDALPCTRPFRNEMCKEIRHTAENSPSHVAC